MSDKASLWRRVRASLVDDWRDAWRWWSMRLIAIGAAYHSLLLLVPADQLLWLWSMLPGETRALLPAAAMHGIPLILFLLAGIGRLAAQWSDK